MTRKIYERRTPGESVDTQDTRTKLPRNIFAVMDTNNAYARAQDQACDAAKMSRGHRCGHDPCPPLQELAEALEDCVAWFTNPPDVDATLTSTICLQRARAALAKAQGK